MAARLHGYVGEPGEPRLPLRFGVKTWVFALSSFVAVYAFCWTRVHAYSDLRACIAHLPADPLHRLIPYNLGWQIIAREIYVALTCGCIVVAFFQAIWLGDHRVVLRWGIALSIVGILRAATIYLIPVCNPLIEAGRPVISEVPRVDLGLFSVPWYLFSKNDLIFSGHTSEVFLLLWATRSWSRWIRATMWTFQVLQIIALMGVRWHYTVDILLALPCAYFADAMALKLLAKFGRAREIVPARGQAALPVT